MLRLTLATLAISTTLSPALAGSDTPTGAYLAYDAALKSARSIEDITPYLSAEMSAEVMAGSDDDKNFMLMFVGGMAKDRKDLAFTGEEISGSTAKVMLTSCLEGDLMSETANLVKEGAVWKMVKSHAKSDGTKC